LRLSVCVRPGEIRVEQSADRHLVVFRGGLYKFVVDLEKRWFIGGSNDVSARLRSQHATERDPGG
jgi:hypothetical protein